MLASGCDEPARSAVNAAPDTRDSVVTDTPTGPDLLDPPR